jgi:type III secretory pathway component EscS
MEHVPGAESQQMIGVFILLGGTVLVASIVGVLDWIAERRHHRSM